MKQKKLGRQVSQMLHEYGTLDQVLASNLSLEIKAACIEMAIQARDAKASDHKTSN